MSKRHRRPTRRRQPGRLEREQAAMQVVDLLEQKVRTGCTARGCIATASRWVSVRDRDSGHVVIYTVCAAHVVDVWDWLGCDKVQECGPEVHAQSTGTDPDVLLDGLCDWLGQGGSLAFAVRGDWSHREVLQRQ